MSAPLIEVVYGAKWLPAAPVLAALGLYGGLRVVFDIFAGYLYARGRSRPVLWVQLLWLVVVVAGMIFATSAYGIVGAAWVHVAAAVVVILPAYLVVLQRAGVQVASILRAAVWPTIGALPATAAALLANLFITNALGALLVGGFAALAVYVITMWPWARRRLREYRRSGEGDAQ